MGATRRTHSPSHKPSRSLAPIAESTRESMLTKSPERTDERTYRAMFATRAMMVKGAICPSAAFPRLMLLSSLAISYINTGPLGAEQRVKYVHWINSEYWRGCIGHTQSRGRCPNRHR